MKVLLIAPVTEQYSGIGNYGVPPIGIHRMASFLEAQGNSVSVYDCNIHPKELLDSWLNQYWDIIGISILNNTLSLSIKYLAEIRKRQPDALLVAGGAEAILNYEEIFNNTDVNIVVLGEGELPMRDLCNRVSYEDINGIIYRSTNVPITDDLLWQYYENIDFSTMGWREYWAKNDDNNDPENNKKIIRLVTSSHCVRGCSFCSLTRLHEFSCGKKVKPAILSGFQIEVLMERALDQLPEITHVYFVEDSILPTKGRIDDFCSGLAPFIGRLKFLVQTETSKVDRTIIAKLADVGVMHISFGVENCSPRIRTLMGKSQDSGHIEDIIGWCNEFGVRCYYLIILFSPESTIEDLRINYETLARWQEADNVVVSIEPFMMPYKGASVYYQDFEFEYSLETLDNKRVLKIPTIIQPKDPQVREIMQKFRDRKEAYLADYNREAGHTHRSKDHTGKVYVKLLGDILNEY